MTLAYQAPQLLHLRHHKRLMSQATTHSSHRKIRCDCFADAPAFVCRTPNSATNRPGTGIYLKLKELSEHDKGVHYQSLRLNSRRPLQDTSTAEAHMGSRLPLAAPISVEDLQGIPVRVIVKHTWTSFLADNLVGRAAELGLLLYLRPLPPVFLRPTRFLVSLLVRPHTFTIRFCVTSRSSFLTPLWVRFSKRSIKRPRPPPAANSPSAWSPRSGPPR